MFFADIQLVPETSEDLVTKIGEAEKQLLRIDWRLHDIVIMPAAKIDDGRADTE